MNTCQICGWQFTTKGNLYQHVRQVHNGEKNYKCKEANCGKKFSRYNDMMKPYHAVHRPNGPRSTKRKFKGEKAVEEVLGDNEIPYIREKKFDGLVGLGGGSLRYDFAIQGGISKYLLIEYDGEQHFRPTRWSSKMTDEEVKERFEKLQKHDQIKNKYAEKQSYPLLRSPYWKRKEIRSIVEEFLGNHFCRPTRLCQKQLVWSEHLYSYVHG